MKKTSLEPMQIVFLGWLSWQSVMLISLLSRVAVLEDRGHIRAPLAKAEAKHNFYASFELFHVPPLISEKMKP